jgi:hypothetical protein
MDQAHDVFRCEIAFGEEPSPIIISKQQVILYERNSLMGDHSHLLPDNRDRSVSTTAFIACPVTIAISKRVCSMAPRKRKGWEIQC